MCLASNFSFPPRERVRRENHHTGGTLGALVTVGSLLECRQVTGRTYCRSLQVRAWRVREGEGVSRACCLERAGMARLGLALITFRSRILTSAAFRFLAEELCKRYLTSTRCSIATCDNQSTPSHFALFPSRMPLWRSPNALPELQS